MFPICPVCNTLHDSVTLNFQFTLDDYQNAFRAHYQNGASAFTRWMMKLALGIGVLLLLTGVLLLVTGKSSLNVVLPPLLLGALWIWIGMGKSHQIAARKQFEKNPALRQPRRVEFSDEGVKTDAGVASSQLSWKAYLRYVESNDTFLLYTNPSCFVIFPKRVLQPEQVSELRQLLRAHIGKDIAVAAS